MKPEEERQSPFASEGLSRPASAPGCSPHGRWRTMALGSAPVTVLARVVGLSQGGDAQDTGPWGGAHSSDGLPVAGPWRGAAKVLLCPCRGW